MLSSLLSSCPIPSCEEQGDQIRPYLTEPKHLKRGDKWYLVDFRWFNEWKKYTSFENKCFGKSIAHPGPVHNAFLFKGENTEELKDYLREGPDYSLLPEEAWNYLINWYGLSLHSRPIMRPVVEAGTSSLKYLMVEVYKNTRDKSK